MPVVHIHVARGRPAGERKAFLDGVHAALVEAFRIPDHDRNQILHEHDPEHLGMGAHGAGTATALELGAVEGAVAGVVMIAAGLLLLLATPALRMALHPG